MAIVPAAAPAGRWGGNVVTAPRAKSRPWVDQLEGRGPEQRQRSRRVPAERPRRARSATRATAGRRTRRRASRPPSSGTAAISAADPRRRRERHRRQPDRRARGRGGRSAGSRTSRPTPTAARCSAGRDRAHEREPDQADSCSMPAPYEGRRPVLYDPAMDVPRPRSRSPRGGRPSRASARSSTRAFGSTRTRATCTTPGPCSSSTRARSATTSDGTSAWRPVDGVRAPANVAHDGRPAIDGGYRMRVLYLERRSCRGAGRRRPSTGRSSTTGVRRGSRPSTRRSSEPDGALEAETRSTLVAERIRPARDAAAGRRTGAGPGSSPRRCGRARRVAVRPPSIAAIAASLRASPTAAARAFRARSGSRPTSTSWAGGSRPPASGSSTATRSPMSRRRRVRRPGAPHPAVQAARRDHARPLRTRLAGSFGRMPGRRERHLMTLTMPTISSGLSSQWNTYWPGGEGVRERVPDGRGTTVHPEAGKGDGASRTGMVGPDHLAPGLDREHARRIGPLPEKHGAGTGAGRCGRRRRWRRGGRRRRRGGQGDARRRDARSCRETRLLNTRGT